MLDSRWLSAGAEPLAESDEEFRSDADRSAEGSAEGSAGEARCRRLPNRAKVLVSVLAALGLVVAGTSHWASRRSAALTGHADVVGANELPDDKAKRPAVSSLADEEYAVRDSDLVWQWPAADEAEVRARAAEHHGRPKGVPPEKPVEPTRTTTEKPAWMTRRGSFIVIGDWGYDSKAHYQNLRGECVNAIAQKMSETMALLADVKFVINVGDSFYPNGVSGKDDPQWENKWRKVFDNRTRSVPWYSIYGNHDYQHDPCACSDDLAECAQVHNDWTNLDFFQMPSWTYWMPRPELDIEIIGMDMNHYMNGFVPGLTEKEIGFADCVHTLCTGECYWRSKIRANVSLNIFNDRMENSPAKNLLVFSHYPTDYFRPIPEFLDKLRDNSKHDLIYFGGHRHNVDQMTTLSIEPNVNWLVGGGGGYSCDGQQQGFVVGEVNEDYSITTYSVLVPYEVCCVTPSTPTTTPQSTTPAEVF